MFTNKLTGASIPVTKEMDNEYKPAQNVKITRQKKRQDNQRSLIGQEIDPLPLLIAEKVRTAHIFEIKRFTAMNEANAKNSVAYVKKANYLKRSRDETKEKIKHVGKNTFLLYCF